VFATAQLTQVKSLWLDQNYQGICTIIGCVMCKCAP